MNKLTTYKRTQVVAALVEGASVNSVVRMTSVSKPTILKLLPISVLHARSIRMRDYVTCLASAFKLMKYGRSALRKTRTYLSN